MTKHLISLAAALALTAPVSAQEQAAPSPGEIVGKAPAADWIKIAGDDLLVMTLAPDEQGNAREVVIQLMPLLVFINLGVTLYQLMNPFGLHFTVTVLKPL